VKSGGTVQQIEFRPRSEKVAVTRDLLIERVCKCFVIEKKKRFTWKKLAKLETKNLRKI
jgi:hypothetical protein